MGTEAIRGGGSLPMIRSDVDTISAALGGDVNAQVAAMVMMSAHEKREQVQQARGAEERYLCAMQDGQVAAMRQQAAHIRAAGISEGMGKIMSGAMAMAGGACALASAGSADGGSKGIEGLKHAKGEIQAGEYFRAASVAAPGAGNVGEGIAGLSAAAESARGKDCEADSAEAGNRADASKRRLEDLRDDEKDAQEMTRTAIDFLRDINQSAAGADRAAIFQRA